MRSLTKPSVASVGLVTRLIADRQGGRNREFFNGIADEWRERVQIYEDSAASPDKVKVWAIADGKRGSFHNLYLSPKEGQAQTQVLKDLRGHKLTHCPCCGEPGRPNTLDHYLPKTTYPHLSVEPLNLIPMCDACQGEKGTKVGDEYYVRFFLHPYFDDFLDRPLLQLSFLAPYNTPRHVVEPHPELEPERFALVRKHICELGLHKRYSQFFEEEQIRLLKLSAIIREKGLDFSDQLKSFELLNSAAGVNTWGGVFYSGVLQDGNLIDYLCNGVLPNFIAS